MVLDQLDELQQGLRGKGGEDDFARWWHLVQHITADLENDLRTSTNERDLLASLRSNVSEYIRDIRDAVPSPSDRAVITAGALRSSIAKRTTGADGWPIA